MTQTTAEQLEKLGESPDMLSIREQVLSQLETAQREKPVITVELDDSPIPEDHLPENASPELIAAVGIDILNQCKPVGSHLIWQGKATKPYGQQSFGVASPELARLEGSNAMHRIVYQRAYGPIPEKAQVKRACEVPLCLRPDHLALKEMPTQYQVEVLVMRPVKETTEIKALSFDDAVAAAHAMPGVIKIFGIREKE